MQRRLFLLLTGILIAASAVAALSPAVKAEIDSLLARLETSACEFNRNGSWYPATDAKAHLLQKLKYLEDRGMVQSTEQFIELAASKSSLSGQPYLVRCANAAPIPSSTWLLSQLQALRPAAKARSAP